LTAINDRYAIVPIESFYDNDLTPAEFRMLSVLYSFRDKNANTVWPSLDAIAERAGYSDITQVSRMTTKLANKGWLNKSKRKRVRGPNVYELTVPDRIQLGRNSQVDSLRQVDISERAVGASQSQVDANSQGDISEQNSTVTLAQTVNSQLDRDGQLSSEQTIRNIPILQQYSEPTGSAAGAAKPVDKSRLERLERFYDADDQDPQSDADNLFTVGVKVLSKYQIPEKRARSMFAIWQREAGLGVTLEALTEFVCTTPPSDPIAAITTLVKNPRSAMPKDWAPSPAALAQLHSFGIPPEVANAARAYFKLWVLEREITSADFDGWFVRWCARDYEDAELDVHRMKGWYGNAVQKEFREPAGGTL
jgi:DNA-binding MarR family transcriptional regulator